MTSYIIFTLRLNFILHTQPNFHIIHLLHAHYILHHYSLPYSLVEWNSYITFTVRLNFVLYTQTTTLCVKLVNYHTQTTFNIISILHVQPIFHNYSLHYSFAEWTSYIILNFNINFVLHRRPTFHIISILHAQSTLSIIYSSTCIAYTSIFTLRITALSYKHPTLYLQSALIPLYTVSLLSFLHSQLILHNYSLHYFLLT